MKETIIPIVIGAFGTVTKGLLKGTGGQGSHFHSNSSEKPSAKTDVKISQGVNNDNNNNNTNTTYK